MQFDLSSDQKQLKQAVRDFAQAELKPRAFEMDRQETIDVELIHKMGELGLFGTTVSPDYGGQGLDTLTYILCVEELARVDASTAVTVAAGNSLGIGPIFHFGTEAQKRHYLPDLCAGKKLWGFGLTEANAGSDAGGTETRAEKKDSQWVINGSKMFITNGSSEITWGSTIQCMTGLRADNPTGQKEFTCFLAENNTPGFTAKPMKHKMCWRASNTSELYFDNLRVDESAMLGKRGEGFHQMLHALDSGRLSIAAMAVGGAQGAYESALTYAKSRKAFGQSVASFQANAFKLADMVTEIEAARLMVYRACFLKDQHKPFKTEAAQAKLYASEVFHRVAHAGVQLHGGYGLMEEYPAARFYRDQRILEIGEGTSEIMRLIISRSLGCYD
jgi:alkylation response protein AidB-like acyl-CoA dehydrogenase